MKRALLFINGEVPTTFPELSDYSLIACTDGAFLKLKKNNFPISQLDFVSGDFDSFQPQFNNTSIEHIYTPDQDKTDFQKALEIIIERGYSEVVVLGASGGEMDHYLGNLFVALKMKKAIKIIFYDEFSKYFFTDKEIHLTSVKGKNISLYPYPETLGLVTEGLQWEINQKDFSLHTQMGIRNRALQNEVKIQYQSGELLVFVEI